MAKRRQPAYAHLRLTDAIEPGVRVILVGINSVYRSLVDRYQSLGYAVVSEWPEIGHDVWRLAWAGGKQWPTLAARRKGPMPKRVTLISVGENTCCRFRTPLILREGEITVFSA